MEDLDWSVMSAIYQGEDPSAMNPLEGAQLVQRAINNLSDGRVFEYSSFLRLNIDCDRLTVRNRLLRFELRRFFGSLAAPWSPEQDECPDLLKDCSFNSLSQQLHRASSLQLELQSEAAVDTVDLIDFSTQEDVADNRVTRISPSITYASETPPVYSQARSFFTMTSYTTMTLSSSQAFDRFNSLSMQHTNRAQVERSAALPLCSSSKAEVRYMPTGNCFSRNELLLDSQAQLTRSPASPIELDRQEDSLDIKEPTRNVSQANTAGSYRNLPCSATHTHQLSEMGDSYVHTELRHHSKAQRRASLPSKHNQSCFRHKQQKHGSKNYHKPVKCWGCGRLNVHVRNCRNCKGRRVLRNEKWWTTKNVKNQFHPCERDSQWISTLASVGVLAKAVKGKQRQMNMRPEIIPWSAEKFATTRQAQEHIMPQVRKFMPKRQATSQRRRHRRSARATESQRCSNSMPYGVGAEFRIWRYRPPSRARAKERSEWIYPDVRWNASPTQTAAHLPTVLKQGHMQPRCWNCGDNGHHWKVCPSAVAKFCRGCGELVV